MLNYSNRGSDQRDAAISDTSPIGERIFVKSMSIGDLRGLVMHCYASWCKVVQRAPHKLLKNI